MTRRLRLPEAISACLFDLDGVLTRTAELHAAGWKQTFDAFLRGRWAPGGSTPVPFDENADYDTYVDGRPRADGVRSFLASRGIELPEGSPRDPASALLLVREARATAAIAPVPAVAAFRQPAGRAPRRRRPSPPQVAHGR
jgi:beta-phosphoglucomutase-like phosphatase (HAD superfamily)